MKIKTLIKNIKFLMKYRLDEYGQCLKKEIYDDIHYEFVNVQSLDNLKVLDCFSTVKLLLEEPKSFCRFGDGELTIMNGGSIPFQKYDERLAGILKEILCNHINAYVGIDYNCFHSMNSLTELSREFYIKERNLLRAYLLENCCKDRTYISTNFNQVYMTYNQFDFEEYYKLIKLLFKDKEIVIFAGDRVFNDIKYDVFELAKSKEFVLQKSMNAFEDYDAILEKALLLPKDKTFVFILGPCSKALVYELSKKDRLAWDIGHMAKDYDWYMRKKEQSSENIANFYKPD